MRAPLTVAVIGVGNFGQQHLAAYLRQPDVEVVAVADQSIRRAEAVATKWGVKQWFANPSELIEDCMPAAVSVVTPGQHHLAPTLTALRHGCSVLLEKPVAMSSAEALVMSQAAAESTGFVMPAHILRFAAPYAAVRAQIAEGVLGQVLGISSRRERTRGHEQLFPGMHPVLMTMIHDVDLALWLTGSSVDRVSAHARGACGQGPPLLVWAHAEAADGTLWSLRTSWVLPDDGEIADQLEVYGSEGAAVLSLEPPVRYVGSKAPLGPELTGDPLADAIMNEITHFCACARAGTSSGVVTLTDAIHGLRIAEAIMASAESGGASIEVATDATR
jgi:predicted dehydrogenase